MNNISNEPLVSVIIAVYNGEKFIHEALQSVLDQTYKNVEIIVIDDGSTDNTQQIVKQFDKIIYQYQEHKGVASARNSGLNLVSGEYIVLFDADDVCFPNKIERQLEFLLENPSFDFCLTLSENFFESDALLTENDIHFFKNEDKLGLNTIMLKKESFEVVGVYNETYEKGSDFEWVTRAKDASLNSSILQEVLLKRRIHGNNLTLKGGINSVPHIMRILKESMARKRNKK